MKAGPNIMRDRRISRRSLKTFNNGHSAVLVGWEKATGHRDSR